MSPRRWSVLTLVLLAALVVSCAPTALPATAFLSGARAALAQANAGPVLRVTPAAPACQGMVDVVGTGFRPYQQLSMIVSRPGALGGGSSSIGANRDGAFAAAIKLKANDPAGAYSVVLMAANAVVAQGAFTYAGCGGSAPNGPTPTFVAPVINVSQGVATISPTYVNCQGDVQIVITTLQPHAAIGLVLRGPGQSTGTRFNGSATADGTARFRLRMEASDPAGAWVVEYVYPYGVRGASSFQYAGCRSQPPPPPTPAPTIIWDEAIGTMSISPRTVGCQGAVRIDIGLLMMMGQREVVGITVRGRGDSRGAEFFKQTDSQGRVRFDLRMEARDPAGTYEVTMSSPRWGTNYLRGDWTFTYTGCGVPPRATPRPTALPTPPWIDQSPYVRISPFVVTCNRNVYVELHGVQPGLRVEMVLSGHWNNYRSAHWATSGPDGVARFVARVDFFPPEEIQVFFPAFVHVRGGSTFQYEGCEHPPIRITPTPTPESGHGVYPVFISISPTTVGCAGSVSIDVDFDRPLNRPIALSLTAWGQADGFQFTKQADSRGHARFDLRMESTDPPGTYTVGLPGFENEAFVAGDGSFYYEGCGG